MAYTDIDKPSDYFNTVTYVANRTDNRQITVGFQPDWTWLKDRDQAVNHDLYDSVRGATKYISSNKTNAEGTQTDGLKSFNSTGFTLGTGWGNQSTGDDYVSWNWKAGGTASSNTDGSITSSVSASTTAGFSIVTYSGNSTAGATVGHGLGVVPSVVLVKSRDGAYGWGMYHHKNTSAPETDYLSINSTDATVDDVNFWNDTAPTSSVFSLGGTDAINKTSNSHVAYVFAEKKGYSKFGSYTGNGNADGPMIVTGMKPAWVMVKKTSGTGNWMIIDNKRSASGGFNVLGERLKANGTDVGSTADYQDHLSNGFKIRTTASSWNDSGGTYIYMAFAENPFTTSTGVPATAR